MAGLPPANRPIDEKTIPDNQTVNPLADQSPLANSNEKITSLSDHLEKSKGFKAKKPKLALSIAGVLLLLISIPAALALVKQRQEIRKEASSSCPWYALEDQCQESWYFNKNDCVTQDDGTINCCCTEEAPPSPAPANCEPAISYSGATQSGMDCNQGSNANVTITACVADGCPAKTITYQETNASKSGAEFANCSGAVGNPATTKTLEIPAGDCANASVSCSPPNNCGTCQVDINDYGVRKWENAGCETTTPTPPEITSTPTPETTVTPPPGITCSSLDAYDLETGEQLTSEELQGLEPGRQLRFVVTSSITGNQTVFQVRYRFFNISVDPNRVTWVKLNPGINEFILNVTDHSIIDTMVCITNCNEETNWY